jgi:hypothetical protein
LLKGCASAPQQAIQIVKIKPDPAWMTPVPVPVRGGETLGDYYRWSFELWAGLQECNVAQEKERLFYLDN